MASQFERYLEWGVTFPLAPAFNLLLATVELHQEEAKHDILSLQFKGALDRNSGNTLSKGDPVSFVWSTNKNKVETFIGFVHLIEKNVTPLSVFTRVICINNSSKLKTPNKKAYKNISADGVVKKIAEEANFYSDTTPHKFSHPKLLQTGQTDWQFLRHLAFKTGYALRAENKTISFKSRDSILADKIDNAPTFYHFDNAPRGIVGKQTLISFTALDSVESPELNQGDVGLELYSENGSRYAFDSGVDVNNGAYVNRSVNTLKDWQNTYGN